MPETNEKLSCFNRLGVINHFDLRNKSIYFNKKIKQLKAIVIKEIYRKKSVKIDEKS